MAGFGTSAFGTSPFGGAIVVAPLPTAGVGPWLYDLLRGPHFAYGYVEGWYGGTQIQVEIDGRMTTRLPLVGGAVEVDGSTPGVRRTLTASFAPLPGLFDQLAPIGTELRAFLVLRGPDGVEVTTAQGVFDVDVQRMGYAGNGDIKVTAPDRWVRVQRSRFVVPRSSMWGAPARQQISTLLNEVMPAGVVTVDLATSTATVPAQVWDRDRDKAIEELAKAASLDVFMDRNGAPTIRDAPRLNYDNVAWIVDEGEGGVLIDADRERNRQHTYNLVVVNGSPNDGEPPFPTQFAWDNEVGSSTYAGPDPMNHPELAGPFGVRPTFFTSPLLRDASQAREAGYTILERVRGLAKQLTLTTITKPDLDDGATILVKLPPETLNGQPLYELHIVDRLSVSLVPSKSPMRIDTRSTAVTLEGAA